ncbi:hypothetical protein [Arthrobacter sp. PsM3]|uniref:hypothetical protein n=1 Tax=Arthrobacter sp. PsM3 TaxID=3030531 RepID=UPI00263A447A|nr:hypothetical protein [Arthrobacter sp. PsM3]MDN4642805.1 hypothetical protein [Arthrobacter sp. PsM3]
MTENTWPQDGSYGTPTATQQTPLRPASTFPPTPNGGAHGASTTSTDGGASKTDAAKDEAAHVTRQAADSAQNVAETAKTEVTNVAAEVKTNARDLLHQAKSDLTDQAGTQQQKVAEGLRSISTELHSMAAASDQPGVATDLVRQAAERSSAVAGWLDGRDPGSLLTEVKSFARQRPGTFLLLAAGAGILAGRLSRSLSAGAPESTPGAAAGTGMPATRIPDTGTAVPPPPVQMPAPETTTAGFADTYPPNPLDADPLAGGNRQDRWESEPVVTDPLRQDPFRDDPFDGGRR